MVGRHRGPSLPAKGVPHGAPPSIHEQPPFNRGHGPMHHPPLHDEMRDPHMVSRHRPPHSAIFEEQLAAQHEDIQGLLVDNQRLAATHVALKQELEVAQQELQRAAHYAGSLHAEKDIQMRELFEKSKKMEMDLREVEAMKAEILQVQADVKDLTAIRQDLTNQVQAMTKDLTRMTTDLQEAPSVKADITNLKKELHQARTAIEYEKKGYAENYEHGMVMEQKLISMARELEKLRAEMTNSEKRARAAAAAATNMGNPGAGYAGHYVNQEGTGYGVAPYPNNVYGGMPTMNHPVQAGPVNYPQYASGPPPPGAWGPIDMQHAQGQR